MINRQALLKDLQKLLQRIEADLLERSESTEVPEVPAALHAEYEKAAKAERTAQNYEDWRTDTITQAAAAWVLSCVFVRFLEDNSLIDPPKIAGPGERLVRSRDEHELYFRSHPQYTDREYLLSIFGELAKLPGAKDIFGEHNAINDLPNWLSGDAAGELLNFFQKIDASTGELVHDFTDRNWDTRFLGDLYQDLSEAARKKFALLQTPDFVEEFILDRTLEPALDEFGLEQDLGSSNHGKLPGFDDRNTLRIPFKMIDPACGSGHFLLGAFQRLLDRWQRKEPGTKVRELTQRVLDGIYGVDINPFAVAIAKFRLLLVAMKACSILRLTDAPAFHINVACGDSLLHGENRTSSGQKLWDYAEGAADEELYSHAYPGEDLQTVRSLLMPGSYHCVVANPPYIVPRDRKLNEWYRTRFSACHRQYSLSVPFMQQIFLLAVHGGYTGQITANSFMKREFGKKLIESFLPNVDLVEVIDASGAHIPGHGTPTVILFGRQRAPIASTLRAVLGIRGEPTVPDEPKFGQVWTSIVNQIDSPGSSSEFVSSADLLRELFHRHPWSIGGGGAAELKELLDEAATSMLGDIIDETGFVVISGEDNVMLIEPDVPKRHLNSLTRCLADGGVVRDWVAVPNLVSLWPNDQAGNRLPLDKLNSYVAFLWPYRSSLKERKAFGIPVEEKGIPWWALREVYPSKLRAPLSIAFAFIATHNHFILDRGNLLFNRSAPVIKLPLESNEELHLGLIGLLNCSTACFWMQQTMHNKGGPGGGCSKDEKWHDFFEFSGTRLIDFPLTKTMPIRTAAQIDNVGQGMLNYTPRSIAKSQVLTKSIIEEARHHAESKKGTIVALQEELDWECYRLYGLIEEDLTCDAPPPIKVGQRAFEILMARQITEGTLRTEWFEWLECSPITELPSDWPTEYRKLVERRIEAITCNPNIGLIETPNCKRRWESEPWESQLERALCEWLLLRLESYFDFDGRMTDALGASDRLVPLGEIAMYSVAQLADAARRDPQFMEVGELYRDDPAFDVQALVEELVLAESVPHVPILRYKDSGLRKRSEWEKTWDLQRREDAGESAGTIPVPPKYTSADFISTGGARYWSLRGKLDVPKERWISFPHCEGPDGTLVICWAGYDHLQQAQAISAYYVRVQTEFGGSDDPRLIPLLASLIELLPWLKQWHNEPNANFDGLRMGDYFEGFVNEEARNLGKTLAEIKAWVPPKKVAKAKAAKVSKNVSPSTKETNG